MTVQELIELLQDMPLTAPIYWAAQPTYPFQYSIDSVIEVNGSVYIVENEQIGHLPGLVSQELGWISGPEPETEIPF